jgi:hypothetical protein
MRVIDFHAHAFPDALAERAIPQLEEEGDIKAALDGKVSSLLRSMDRAGIEKCVLCSIATRPEQFKSILRWSKDVASDRLIPFPSVHPRDPAAAEGIKCLHDEGFKGVKFHPYYQDFFLEEEALLPIYEAAERHGLIFVVHTGFDLAFERIRRADPARIVKVLERFPRLKFVATHLGAWEDWDEVRKHLLGKPVYMETSFSLSLLGREKARELILSHPPDRWLFGTDSPWEDQGEALREIKALDLGADLEERMLWRNAEALLSQDETS